MNVAFLANSFHLSATKSTDFLIDLLKEWFGSVQVVPHKEAWARLPGTHWDLIVVFQHLWPVKELEAFGAERVVLVPMYDDCPKDELSWRPYLGIRILSFSSSLGSDLASWGHEVRSVQYWQPVPPHRVEDFSTLRGFFWPRTAGLTWSHVRPLLAGAAWHAFHLHITTQEGARSLPSDGERKLLNVTQTSWFERADDARAAVASANVYFAPRRFEGIGQAVLEALALGLCVVAPDSATMNEYIEHGRNGLLYDPDHPKPLDLGNAAQLGSNARQAALSGRARWEASLGSTRDFLIQPMKRKLRHFHPWIILRGRTIALLRSIYRWVKRIAGRV